MMEFSFRDSVPDTSKLTHQFRGKRVYLFTLNSNQLDPFASELSNCARLLIAPHTHSYGYARVIFFHNDYKKDAKKI